MQASTDKPFDTVKVFSATRFEERSRLGDEVTRWLRPRLEDGDVVVNTTVTQSSDRAFHCLTITLFLRRRG